jgi:hypothetical protein
MAKKTIEQKEAMVALSNPLIASIEAIASNQEESDADKLAQVLKVTRELAEVAAQPIEAQAAPDLVSELNNIDFGKMIGGPLNAAIQAQAASAITTVNFIKEVGFKPSDADPDKLELVMVDFSHTVKDIKADGTADIKERFIKVPFIAMLPIPSIRIETVDIDFNCKLNSVETTDVSTKLGVNVSVGGGFGPVKFKVSSSVQRQSSYGLKVQKEYTLNVKVKASQDEMPAGLEKILNMLAA